MLLPLSICITVPLLLACSIYVWLDHANRLADHDHDADVDDVDDHAEMSVPWITRPSLRPVFDE